MARVLLLDDEPAILRAYRRTLSAAGHEVDTASDGPTALQMVRTHPVDVIVSDVSMPGMDGLRFLRAVREFDSDVSVILMSAQATLNSALQAVEFGAFRYLEKPVASKLLVDTVTLAAGMKRLAALKREALATIADPTTGESELRTRFESALSSLWVAFQPIVSWGSRSVFGYEALVRTGDANFPHPGVLLDAAQRLQELPRLGRTIRRLASEAFRNAPSDATLFVNLHPQDLQDDELFDPNAPLAPFAHRVVLEITERSALEQVGHVSEQVRRLRAIGYRIAVDDLGAGYAGLGHFAQLEPEIVKLDMSLVRDIDKHPTKQSVVRSMIALCRELRISSVVEGIETPAERDAVATCGGDLLQGYLFARPGKPFPSPSF